MEMNIYLRVASDVRGRLQSIAFFTTVLLIFTGCSQTVLNTRPLEVPISRENDQIAYTWSQLPEGGTASIGDRLFWVRRYVRGAKEEIPFTTLPGMRPFPSDAIWSKTHSYDGDDGRGLFVYTTPDFYRGELGVILDSEERAATNKPLIQVEGRRAGRRWSIVGKGKFFVIPDNLIEQWGVRFGGRRGGEYLLEIVDSPNPNTSQVTQTLQLPKEEFFAGVTIRGVFLKALEDSGSGVIKFSLRDDRVSR